MSHVWLQARGAHKELIKVSGLWTLQLLLPQTQTYKQSLPGLMSLRALKWFLTLCCRLLDSFCETTQSHLPAYFSFTGLSGLAEAPGVAGRPPGREIRCVGPPASRQTDPTVWKLVPGGQHQDFLVRDHFIIINMHL